ncbi:phosphoenolpyruvate carboxylase [Klebsiella pneumoniae]|uniref:phosphoenolpyruvate carboxylase n=1 Tax=Klebsiella pneumoniae TaxID=573 RepID=UPI003985D745
MKSFGVPPARFGYSHTGSCRLCVLGEMTRYLGIGDYESWSGGHKQAFLIRELNSKRPLLPRQQQGGEDQHRGRYAAIVIEQPDCAQHNHRGNGLAADGGGGGRGRQT